MSRRPPRRRRPGDDRFAVALQALREDYFAVRPAPDLRARVRAALAPRLHAAARRAALRLAASLLLGLLGGWLLARAGTPGFLARLAHGTWNAPAASPDPRGDAATARLRRLVATAETLPRPPPEVLASWAAALSDDDPDVRAAAAALLRAAGPPGPCGTEAP